MLSGLALIMVLVAVHVGSIPIDNEVQGEAEISCGPNSITINFNTRNPWEGKLYVKNQFGEGNNECVVSGSGNSLASIELNFDQCGVQRARSLEPRGVFVWITVVMSFHPTFITKVDQAVRAQCFYMEADKTVSQDLEVSMLTTALATFNVPMPVCKYEIRETEDIGSDPVKFAIVGQSVWHHWVCETDYVDTFCSVPYGCFVDDGTGNAIVQLLDDDGCSLDANLLDNPEYRGDLWAAKESHVFKYADKPNLYFNCQMRVTIKEPGQECPRPTCATAPRTNGKRKRSADEAVTDVAVDHPIMVADVDFTEEDVPLALLRHSSVKSTWSMGTSSTNQMCVSQSGLALLCAIMLALITVTALAMAYVIKQRKQ